MLMTTPTSEGDAMSLDTNLYFFRRDDDAPALHRRDVMDAIAGRLPDFEWRQRIAEHGALRVAMKEFAWLFNERGVESLFDPPVHAFLKLVDAFCAPFVSLPFDDACIEAYARLRAQLRPSCTTLGANDLMIASIALTHGLDLVSDDRAAFARVPGLRVTSWRES
jgi:predicted nucleic acid-binding protein